MEALQNRIDSFSKARRVKNPSKPSSSVSVKWTRPSALAANPESLAEAGFYFTPTFDSRDSVTCYMCEQELGGWEAEDDPFDLHWDRCGTNCCWASVRCGLRSDMDRHGGYTFSDKTRLPTSKTMERARLETFSAGDGWIHDQEKNHGANSRNMARAGFVYTPQVPGDDLATCLYCNVSLSGWDADDDPVEEHRKRDRKNSNRCPFFNFSESKSKESIVSDDELGIAPASTNKRSTRGRTTSGSSTAGKPSRKTTSSQSRNKLGDVAEDDEDAETHEEPEAAPVAKRGRPRRTTAAAKPKAGPKSKVAARQTVEDQVDSDDEAPAAPAKATSRTRSKAKEAPVEEEPDDAEDEPKLKKSTRTTRAASHSRKPSKSQKVKVIPESDADAEEIDEEPPQRVSRAKSKASSTSTSRKPSRTRSKAAVTSEKDGHEEDHLDVIVPVKKRTTSASKQGSAEPPPSRSRGKQKSVSPITEHIEDLPEIPDDNTPEPDETHIPDAPIEPSREPSPVITSSNLHPNSNISLTVDEPTLAPLFCPPLAKLPFMPASTLTDAELDMSVEEWIRYQMEVEYDKFRRDGERELAKFKKKAEEVRKVIVEL